VILEVFRGAEQYTGVPAGTNRKILGGVVSRLRFTVTLAAVHPTVWSHVCTGSSSDCVWSATTGEVHAAAVNLRRSGNRCDRATVLPAGGDKTRPGGDRAWPGKAASPTGKGTVRQPSARQQRVAAAPARGRPIGQQRQDPGPGNSARSPSSGPAPAARRARRTTRPTRVVPGPPPTRPPQDRNDARGPARATKRNNRFERHPQPAHPPLRTAGAAGTRRLFARQSGRAAKDR